VDAHVLVPLKALDRAKSRLAEALIPEERAELMRSLLDHVVGEIREAGLEQITVVTTEPLEDYETWDDHGLAWNDALAAAKPAKERLEREIQAAQVSIERLKTVVASK